ncbi:MAG: hypothetical protein GWN62_16765, partial [Aliifodinibius sp.]|nr:hypothetical protein [Fodinibius sp.]
MISIFNQVKETTPVRNMSMVAFLDAVQNGEWQDIVLAIRTGKEQKLNAPCVTASGVFKTRKKSDLLEHSGFICIDIDAKDQIAEMDVDAITSDPYLYAIHRSISGQGYAAYYRVDPKRHLDAFLGLEQYLFINYSIVVDKSCKDVSRLRFVSYDPDLYINEKSKIFKKYLKKAEKANIKAPKPILSKNDFNDAVRIASGMNLFDDYNDYIHLAFALCDEFGESGRGYFHDLCRSSEKYDAKKCDKDYDICLRRQGAGVTIKTVYWKFKQAGIKIESEKTETIKKVA